MNQRNRIILIGYLVIQLATYFSFMKAICYSMHVASWWFPHEIKLNEEEEMCVLTKCAIKCVSRYHTHQNMSSAIKMSFGSTLLHLQCNNLINLRYAIHKQHTASCGPQRNNWSFRFVYEFMIYFWANMHKSKLLA